MARVGNERGIRGGFALLELMIAVGLLTLTVGAIAMALGSLKSLSRSSEERAIAQQAVQGVIEEIRATEPGEVFARFNSTVADDLDPDDPGDRFAIRGLNPLPTDADGFVGRITFPGDGVELREDFDDVELGMRRDLNGDGQIDGVDRAGSYTVLPLRVSAEWGGKGGWQRLDVVFVVTNR